MAPKEPTRAQLSSRLTYNAETPAFLRQLQSRVAGGSNKYEDDEMEQYGDRPPIPTRPEGEANESDEESADEKPQVVVLKEGKHLTAEEVTNEKRRAMGLPPLTSSKEKAGSASKDDKAEKTTKASAKSSVSTSMSFSSKGASSTNKKGATNKRKVIGDDGDNDANSSKDKKPSKKKPKKEKKSLLSFGGDGG